MDCLACDAGFLCEEGSSVQLPASCNAGTFIPHGVTFTSAKDCIDCQPGSSCYGGSAQPKACTAGTAAPDPGTMECDSCQGGTYQAILLLIAYCFLLTTHYSLLTTYC